ncbi:type II toxin-antitoxin system HigB family toxin [Endozoicomonas sp. SM1973]|uniref:Type II toxin-antitoxin system HigB family toxin n=1 Tax=Spartinivicinus marinus TaxID=2994442 RepID=A0A853II70_9GAMM|nr:type II toxin-antitoxin system HigB family toxin [Spartinivicinus marinus]
MRIISRRTLREFWEQPNYSDSKGQLEAWHDEVLKANWSTPQEVKAQFRSASILKNNRVVFNIAGNKYRIIVRMDYQWKLVFVRFIGTHTQYDQVNADEV